MRLSFGETQALLAKHGIPSCRQGCAKTLEGVLEHARGFSYPLVLKVLSPGASHKTERGLVKLNIADRFGLKQAFWDLQARARGLAVDCFLVQEQLKGAEFIVGGKRDASFGPVVLFGTGGVLTELFGDVAVRAAPLSPTDARALIRDTKAAAFFTEKGVRGRKADEAAVAGLLQKTGKLLLAEPRVAELDFNPVVAEGKTAFVVDARIEVADGTGGRK